MQRFFNIAGWVLLALAAGVLIVSPFVSANAFDPLKNALPAGVLVALAANLLTQAKNLADEDDKRSAFYLKSAIEAYEQGRSLLQDGNCDRSTWIEAGRCLGHAKALAADVKLGAHKRVLELNRLKYRTFFAQLLEDKPASFFYGAPSASRLSLEEAAKSSTASEERNGRITVSTNRELDEQSIRAVWEAAQWPTNYSDPLPHSFTDQELDKLIVLFPGLHSHFMHRRQWTSAAGRLYPRKDARDG
jgi:hypothetical protein